jgi:hypothetical protein
MVRYLTTAFVLLCLAAPASAQTQPAPGTAAPPAAAPPTKPAVKKPAPKAKAAAKPSRPADTGACDLGVIITVGAPIGVQKIGITIFGTEYSEVPFDAWGIDDLIDARVRVAAGAGAAVRRITVGKEGLYDLYEKPGKGLFNNPKENLMEAVRKIAANSRCARHILFSRINGKLAGTNQFLQGIGVVTHGPFGRAAVFANFQVNVFDGPSFAVRDDPFGSFGARMSIALSKLTKDDSIRTAENTEFPASPEAAAKDTKLRDTARALVAERLDLILPEYLKE